MEKIKAVNWNKPEKDYYPMFWNQNVRQFWVDEEIPVSDDKNLWESGEITDNEKIVYENILANLTVLDTLQGNIGMPSLVESHPDYQAKAIFTFMAMMEQMHAKSYSTIFSTISSSERIEELIEYTGENKHIQAKIEKMQLLFSKAEGSLSPYIASVLLETMLFYSGFYLPLLFAGRGQMMNSGEIIKLIIRDESIHGVFTGLVYQDLLEVEDGYAKFAYKQLAQDFVEGFFEIEKEYVKELYAPLGIEEDVLTFVKYNADKALMNLGYDSLYNVEEHEVNPIVINGLNTETNNHDFFSAKGNGYIKSLNIESNTDETFWDVEEDLL